MTIPRPLIVVTVSGGVVQHVAVQGCAKVLVHDYDVEGCDRAALSTDDNSQPFMLADWTPVLDQQGYEFIDPLPISKGA